MEAVRKRPADESIEAVDPRPKKEVVIDEAATEYVDWCNHEDEDESGEDVAPVTFITSDGTSFENPVVELEYVLDVDPEEASSVWLTNQLRKQRTEVSIRKCSPVDQEKFVEAKDREIKE